MKKIIWINILYMSKGRFMRQEIYVAWKFYGFEVEIWNATK